MTMAIPIICKGSRRKRTEKEKKEDRKFWKRFLVVAITAESIILMVSVLLTNLILGI